MIDISSLNPEQREAVSQYKGPMMILAGAGTGKTRVITYRIAYMLDQGVDPKKIVAMTFTNKAAKEMQERIAALVGPKFAKKISISTFHSFCLKILRSNVKLCQLANKFSLVGTSDQLDLLRRSLEEKKWTGLYRPDQLHAQISQCKNYLLTPQDLRQGKIPEGLQTEHIDLELLAEVYALYERQLELNRAIDFDDCILKVVKTLENNSEFRASIQESFRYILVDEFQDTNASQFAVLEKIVGNNQNICVVGDDDQSIYSWRGAMFETLERFEKCFKGTKIVKLEQNYRCSNIILNAANAVIKNNLKRKKKTLWSDSKVSRPIILSGSEDSTAEARWIAEKCAVLVGRGYKLNEIAILYRANTQAKLIEMALRECGLHYKTYGGQSFFERKEVKDFLCYVRLVVNPNDHLSLWRIINIPHRGIGLKTQEIIEKLAKELGVSPFKALGRPELESMITPQSFRGVRNFVALMTEFMKMPLDTPQDCVLLGSAILEKTGLLEHVKSGAKNYLAQQHKMNSLKGLPDWMGNAASDLVESQGKVDCIKLLDSLTLGDEQQFAQDEKKFDHISLMTIHRSKGLEFPAIFVTGLEEGCLPHKNSIEEGDLQINEERRLFYVAMTRAKKELFLTYSKMRQNGFQKEKRTKSRFLDELPEGIENTDVGGKNIDPSQISKSQTLSKISQLRSSFLNS